MWILKAATAAFDYYKSGSSECGASDVNCAGDTNGHGTHCAGTIGGKKYGVAKKTALYSLKVLNPSGSDAAIIASLDYVMSKGNKPAVWSASLGGPGTRHMYADTFIKAKAANVLISVAAGNSNADACHFSPAFAPAAITVGATQIGDTRASFSNYGTCIDIFAPGKNVLSAWWNSDTASKSISGTSMACPHVSGVAALIYADFPGVQAADVEYNIKDMAGKQLVKDPKAGSPNLMLHVPSWAPGSPIKTMPTTTTTTSSMPAGTTMCGFESSSKPYCGIWSDASGDKFDWTRQSGKTPSSSTGPSSASKGSYYLFIEASSPRKNGDKAVLESKPVKIGKGAFVQFDYHMFGGSIGSLKVEGVGTSTQTVGELKGKKGNKWLTKTFQLDPFEGQSIKLKITGVRGDNWDGDIAIDNVIVFSGGASGPPGTTMPPTTVPPTTVPPTTAPPTTMPPTTMPPTVDLGKKVEALQAKLDEILKILKSLSPPN
jgi:hypothetical protein